jgi:hypothetical protein
MNEIIFCKWCGSENIQLFDEGYSKVVGRIISWEAHRCLECGEITSNEPDPDFEKGGHDDL